MKTNQNMRRLLAMLLGLNGLSIGAQENSKEQVVYEKTTKIDFSDREVDGEFMNPDGRSVKGDNNLYFDSLFEDRKNFRQELKRSSEAVR